MDVGVLGTGVLVVAMFVAGGALGVDRLGPRSVAQLCVRAAGVIYPQRSVEFRGELAGIQSAADETGLEYAVGTLWGASVERVSAVRQPLRLHAVTKTFGSTRAVAGVSLDVEPGSITALLGGNGSGKSTLIKLIAGVHEADRGTIRFGDTAVQAEGIREQIGFVRHDTGLFPEMSVTENLAFAQPLGRFMINHRAERAAARQALAAIGFGMDPDAMVKDLTAADRQLVCIAREVARGCELLVLDEPSDRLSQRATADLFATLGHVRALGLGILFVSHKIDDVVQLADRVAVLRDGELVHDSPTVDTDADEIIRHIVGGAQPDDALLTA